MALTKASLIDLNGQELILDADADTSITADTDDQIDFKIGGTDVATLTAGTLKVVNTGNTDTLILESTDADANTGPVMVLHRNSASPAEGDLAGEIRFDSEDTAGNQTTIAKIQSILGHPNHGESYAEDGRLTFSIIKNATLTEVMRLSEDARVGIGTNDPAQNLHIHCDSGDEGILLKSTGNTNNALTIDANRSSAGGALGEIRGLWNGTEVARIVFRGGDDTTNKDDGFMTFATSTADNISERMRLDSSGRLLIGLTASSGSSSAVLQARGTAAAACVFDRTNNGVVIGFKQNGGSDVGSISITSSSTAFVSGSSDLSLKENIVDWNENVLDKFKDIKPVTFNFISDESKETKKGYIAQNEVDKFPEAYPKNPNDEKYSFNPSGMVTYLMKAIQELSAKVEELESKINE